MRRAFRRGDAGQDVGDLPGGTRVDDFAAPGRAPVEGEPHGGAAVRPCRVELDEVAQRQADAAEADRQTGSLAGRQGSVDAAGAEAGQQPGRADGVEQPHGGDVERHLKGVADRHVALELGVEIARTVAAEACRPILDDRLLSDHALFEGEAVDERLQRRAGRADRPGHVDRSGAARVEKIGRTDLADDLAGARVGHHQRDGHFRAEPLGGLARDNLQTFLHRTADRHLVASFAGTGGEHVARDMGCERG